VSVGSWQKFSVQSSAFGEGKRIGVLFRFVLVVALDFPFSAVADNWHWQLPTGHWLKFP
jgi:hypothetical protein